jgi:hypothetical protein
MSAFGMLLEGKVGGAIVRVIETVFGISLPKPLSDLIHKFTSDAGKVIWDAATVGVADIKAGKDIHAVADDIVADLASKGTEVAKADVLDALGLQARAN